MCVYLYACVSSRVRVTCLYVCVRVRQLLKIDGKAFDSVMTAAGQLRGEPDTTVTLLLQTPNGNSYTVSPLFMFLPPLLLTNANS